VPFVRVDCDSDCRILLLTRAHARAPCPLQNLHAYIESRIPQTMIRHFALHVFEGYVFATQRAAVAAGSKALKAPKTLRPDTLTRVAALLECPDHGPNALYAEICDDRGAVLRAYIDV